MGRSYGWFIHTTCRRNWDSFEKRDHLEYAIHLQFQTTNNESEYEALLQSLELAKLLGEDSVLIQGDSQLVIGQVNGT